MYRYLDDIITFSQTGGEQILHVHAALSRLHKTDVTLNIKKCKFFTEKIHYLGHVIRTRNLKLPDHTAEVISDLKKPRNVSEWKLFPGLCNIYQQFVPNSVCTAAPYHMTMEKCEQKMFDTIS